MLTLIRGRSRKLIYLTLLYKGTDDGILINLVDNCILNTSVEHWKVTRPLSTMGKITMETLRNLKECLEGLFENIINETDYKKAFLYGNFNTQEVSVLKELTEKFGDELLIIATIQDNNVPDGQIIIEEII